MDVGEGPTGLEGEAASSGASLDLRRRDKAACDLERLCELWVGGYVCQHQRKKVPDMSGRTRWDKWNLTYHQIQTYPELFTDHHLFGGVSHHAGLISFVMVVVKMITTVLMMSG